MLSVVRNLAPSFPPGEFEDPGPSFAPRVLIHRPRGLNSVVELWSGRQVERPWVFFPNSFAFCHLPGAARPSFWTHCKARYDADPTSIAVLAPTELIRTATTDRMDFDMVLVEANHVDKFLGRASECGERRHFRPALVKDPMATLAMLELVGALRAPVSDAVRTDDLLATFLTRIFRRAQDAPSENPPSAIDRVVERARVFVNTHFAEKIGLDQVAKAAGMSKFHLERTFHSKLGLPIHQYLKRVRIGRALELLRTGRRPIHVAQLVGFADQPHMTRSFRCDLGFTPSQYLRGRGAQDSRASGYSVSSSLSGDGRGLSSSLADSFCGRGIP